MPPRRPAGLCLPEVAPPLEDPPGRGELSLVGIIVFKFTASQELEQWEPETDDEEGTEQAFEVVLIVTFKATSGLSGNGEQPDKGCCHFCHCSWTKGES